MPGFKDLAATPTSWALTFWDAVPIILSVEAALAVLILGTLTGRLRATGWQISGLNIAGGIAYLTLFGSGLTLVFALLGAGIVLREIYGTGQARRSDVPASPLGGLATRVWALIGAIAASAAAAAAIKILVGPFVDAENPAWLGIAALGGLLPLGTFGTAAIPALATATTTDSILAGIVWLVAAAVRPLLWQALTARRASALSAASD